jgi:hypothetical protein
MRFKVARSAGGADWTIIGASHTENPVANQLNTYATRIPVRAGDVIGYFATGPSFGSCAKSAAGYSYSFFLGDPNVGETRTYSTNPSTQLDIAATFEADADNDGYGDETQDQCPSDPQIQNAPCRDKTAPETTIGSKPPKKTKSKKASFAFSASEASTFKCSLDGAAFDACTSPKTYSVGKGKHVFTVFAKDAAGNVDDSPATYAWTVKKKKR